MIGTITVSSAPGDVSTIFSTEAAFAALKNDGSVVTWGDPNRGGSSKGVDLSRGVGAIYSTQYAFAAILNDADGDGVLDNIDALPDDPTEYIDTDSDNIGDNSDEFPTISTQDILNAIDSNPTRYNRYSLDDAVTAIRGNPTLYNLYSPDDIEDLRVGSTMIEVSDGKVDITVILEETSDVTDWSNATKSEKTIQIDAPTGTRFYRFKLKD